MLKIDKLYAAVENKEVISGISLDLSSGESLVVMGANGSGKSSLANILMGNDSYTVTSGSVKFVDKDLLAMSVTERAREGVYLAWQNPMTVPGVSVFAYLRAVYEAKGLKIESMVKFKEEISLLAKKVGLADGLVGRNVNEGFSGGEKKRFELLQIMMLKPKLVILDEIDSGLDVDGLKLVGEVISTMQKEHKTSFLVITHYKRLLEYVEYTKVVILSSGKIILSGGSELVNFIERQGYRGLVNEGK